MPKILLIGLLQKKFAVSALEDGNIDTCGTYRKFISGEK